MTKARRGRLKFVKRLGFKLKSIRHHLNLSQAGMYELLNPGSPPGSRSLISQYERGKRNPSFPEILIYARLVKVPVEQLIDDQLELLIPPG